MRCIRVPKGGVTTPAIRVRADRPSSDSGGMDGIRPFSSVGNTVSASIAVGRVCLRGPLSGGGLGCGYGYGTSHVFCWDPSGLFLRRCHSAFAVFIQPGSHSKGLTSVARFFSRRPSCCGRRADTTFRRHCHSKHADDAGGRLVCVDPGYPSCTNRRRRSSDARRTKTKVQDAPCSGSRRRKPLPRSGVSTRRASRGKGMCHGPWEGVTGLGT